MNPFFPQDDEKNPNKPEEQKESLISISDQNVPNEGKSLILFPNSANPQPKSTTDNGLNVKNTSNAHDENEKVDVTLDLNHRQDGEKTKDLEKTLFDQLDKIPEDQVENRLKVIEWIKEEKREKKRRELLGLNNLLAEDPDNQTLQRKIIALEKFLGENQNPVHIIDMSLPQKKPKVTLSLAFFFNF